MIFADGQLVGGTHVYLRTRFDPKRYNLTANETRALLAQVNGLRATDELYLLQVGGETNRGAFRDLESAARKTNNPNVQEYQLQWEIFGGRFDSATGKKIKPGFTAEDWKAAAAEAGVGADLYGLFSKDEAAPKGANCFVNETDMNDEAFAKWMQQKFDSDYASMSEVQRASRSHPLLDINGRVVVYGSYGDYKIENTPWINICPDLVKEVAESLWAAGEVCQFDSPQYAALLRTTGAGLLSNDFVARDAMMPFNDSRLYTFAGITEEYTGSALGWSFARNGGFDFLVGMRDPEMSASIEKATARLPKMIETLPKELRNTTLTPPVIHALNMVYIAGESQHAGYTIAARNWPNPPVDKIFNHTRPYIVMHISEGNARTRYLVKPAAMALLPEGSVPSDDVLTKCARTLTTGHELNHAVGMRKIYDTALEEGRATAGGIFHFPIILESQAEAEQFCWAEVPNILRTIRAGSDHETGVVNEAHSIGENVLFDMMLESGAVEVIGGKVEVKPQAMLKTAGEYFVKASELQYQGKQGPIDEFLAPHRKLDKRTLQLISNLNAIKLPRSLYVDRGPLEELEATLNEHLKAVA